MLHIYIYIWYIKLTFQDIYVYMYIPTLVALTQIELNNSVSGTLCYAWGTLFGCLCMAILHEIFLCVFDCV